MRRRAYWLVFVLLLWVGCDRRGEPREEETPDDDDSAASDDDDSSAGDDDDSAGDFEWKGEPELLATYDFTLVMVKNAFTNQFAAYHGQMDVLTTETQLLAELRTDDGRSWDWFGNLLTTSSFEVFGDFEAPGTDSYRVVVAGNFLADAGQVDGSSSCLTGIGKDDDPNLGSEEGEYIEFTWYACRRDAAPAAVDRSGAHGPSVVITHWDNCGAAWSTWSPETWTFEGRNLIVTNQRGSTGWGVVSDDGQLFRYTMLDVETPGRSIKVLGDFESMTSSQAIGHGYCGDGSMSPDSRVNLSGY